MTAGLLGFPVKRLKDPGMRAGKPTGGRALPGPSWGSEDTLPPPAVYFGGGPCGSEGNQLENESPGHQCEQRKKVFVGIRRSDGAFRL